MSRPDPPLDLTPEDLDEVLRVVSELERDDLSRHVRAAELVLLRKIFEYARQYRYHFPPRMQHMIRTLGRRSHLELLLEEHRTEFEKLL